MGELKSRVKTKPIVVCKLSNRSFSDPNSIMNDVDEILNVVRPEILDKSDVIMREGGIDIVLLSRRALDVAATSSPILLPDWFPINPNHTVTASIEDVTWTASTSLKDDTLGVFDLHRILFELEVLLIECIQRTLTDDRTKAFSLWEQLREGIEDKNLARVLPDLRGKIESVENPGGYRPSARKNGTIIGRLWYRAITEPPERLTKLAKALACSLRVESSSQLELTRPSLVTVLNRPSNRIQDSSVLWAFNLIVTLRSACQLVTAAAHADEYPRYPILLLKSLVYELVEVLDQSISVLNAVLSES